jgi:NADPH-dependent curcumin reductase CurA
LETAVEGGFERLPTALNMLFDGANTGKLVLRVAD